MKLLPLASVLLLTACALAAPTPSATQPGQPPILHTITPTTVLPVSTIPAPTSTVTVKSLADLQKALDAAAPGTQINLADGVYTAADEIKISRPGSKDHPIIISAASPLGAEIKGKHGFNFTKEAQYVILQNFKFTYSCSNMELPVGATHNRITRNSFILQNDARSPYITVSGDDNELDHNYFTDKHTEGCYITVQGPGGDKTAQHTWIHHNHFNNFLPSANNCSAIQIGLSGRSMSSAFSLVEYNLFTKMRGENEGSVCNKSCDNIYRFNTFTDTSRELSLRHGNRCQVYANYFINADGLRFYGHDHLIFSNYFERCNTPINIGNGDGIIPPAILRAHDKPVGCYVAFNTLVNNKTNIMMGGRNNGYGAANITVADNLIVGGPKAAAIGGKLENPTWLNNLISQTNGGAGDLPKDTFSQVDAPLKSSEPNGPYILPSNSPVIAKSAGNFPWALIDLHGTARPNNKTPGAEEPLSKSPTLNPKPLTEKDVGPNAK